MAGEATHHGDDRNHRIVRPSVQTIPLVFCSPHSGRSYPADFVARSRLTPHVLRKSEDCFVDELFAEAPSLGAPLIAADFPRAFVDVNREPYELDPELFADRVPPFANSQSARVIGGLGTIPRIVADGEEIYGAKLPIAEGLDRIERYYRPFHAALSGLLEATLARFGVAILIDCHSMPSASSGATAGQRPHIILGDRFGKSCDGGLTRTFRDIFQESGLEVRLNRPYAGGFITEHYGRPARGVHALQIEINRALYLDEARLQKSTEFGELRSKLTTCMRRVVAARPWEYGTKAAAE